MKYKGKNIEVIGNKILFGKETLWIHILEYVNFNIITIINMYHL